MMRGPAAPKPASARPASSVAKSGASAQHTPPTMNRAMPEYRAGFRPVLSDSGP
jgi:hypothetical protein